MLGPDGPSWGRLYESPVWKPRAPPRGSVMKESLTFDDVLLIPQYSTVKSRKDVDVSVQLGPFKFAHPLIPANMASVMEEEMAATAINNGGLAILHRFASLEYQSRLFLKLSQGLNIHTNHNDQLGFSLGVNQESYHAFDYLYADTGCKIWCLDIAHADHELAIKMIRFLKSKEKKSDCKFLIIAGNVVTGAAAKRLWDNGADVVKCGIGSGSICSSRIVAGHGRGQLSALMDVHDTRRIYHPNKFIISDGGCRTSGDLVKALCFSEMVMAGNLFAGCHEAPGHTTMINSIPYKEYNGSSTYKKSHIEGVRGFVPVSDSYENVLTKLLEGVKSGCSYSGVGKVKDLQINPILEKITGQGLTESKPHDIVLDT